MGIEKNDALIKGAWKELKQKIFSAIHTLKAKNGCEIIASGPLATNTPASTTTSVAASSTTVPSKSFPITSKCSSNTSVAVVAEARDESPPQSVSFKEIEESQALKSQRLIEYVLKNVKDLDRVSGIKISIERRFNEIH